MSDMPAPTKLSATVLLLRDNADLEVLMVKRHYQIDFASGALVFPGGKAHEEDADPAWASLSDCDFEGDPLTARVAAAREAFEESGILLARPAAERGVDKRHVGSDVADRLAPLRGPIDRREASFLEMIRDNDLILALDTLIHFAHWITPIMMPKRFDTHFYLAPTPPEQIASHDGRETTDTTWINPNAALEMAEVGDATIIFPTRMVLGKLGEADSVAAAKSQFDGMNVVTVEPKISKDDDGNPILKIPEEAGYMTTIEPLERVSKDVGMKKAP